MSITAYRMYDSRVNYFCVHNSPTVILRQNKESLAWPVLRIRIRFRIIIQFRIQGFDDQKLKINQKKFTNP